RRDPRHHRPGTHHQHPHLAAAAVPAARRPPAGRRRPEHPAVADDLLRRRVTGTPGRGGEVVRPLPQRGVRHERAPDDQYLPGHPDVRQAAVVGVPDELFGEAPHAYVVPAPGATVTTDELRQLVVDQLSAEWAPREVEFIDALPLTGAGKVDKKALRARYLS